MLETLSSHHTQWLMGPYGDGRHLRMRPHPKIGRLVLMRGYSALGNACQVVVYIVYMLQKEIHDSSKTW